MRELPERLLEAWRAVEDVPDVVSFGQFSWNDQAKRWWFPLRLRAQGRARPPLDDHTAWVITASPAYPSGEISVYPDGTAGLEATFPHQRYNGPPEVGTEWRTGKLCLDPGVAPLDRRSANPAEPHSPADRLAWHVARTREWLEAARTDTLRIDGDPFELPDYPTAGSPRLGFFENAGSLSRWRSTDSMEGLFRALQVGAEGHTIAVEAFLDGREGEIVRLPWGPAVGSGERLPLGVWIRLEALPVLPPWQAPATWGELRIRLNSSGCDLDGTIARYAPRLRDGARHLLLLGAPIPDRIGDESARVHWLAILMPRLARPGDRGVSRGRGSDLARRDRTTVMGAGVRLAWLETENWADGERTRRGRYREQLRETKTLVLGAGAVGSIVSECLVRSGVTEIGIVDHDALAAGNLVRHSLDLNDLDRNKAVGLADRLNRLSPTARALGFPGVFPDLPADAVAFAESVALVVDCTADDEVIRSLAQVFRAQATVIASAWLGALAERLYLYTAVAPDFEPAAFFTAFRPWSELDRARLDQVGEIREGVGCWNPVFPARFDHVVLLCAAAVGVLEELVEQEAPRPRLMVLERVQDGSGASTVRIRSSPP